MECFQMDLTEVLRVVLLGKESLIPPRTHYSRYLTEYVMYVIVSGSMRLKVNGRAETLEAGDIWLFRKGDSQEPMDSSFCEYYYVHFQAERIYDLKLSEIEYSCRLRKKQEQYLTADSFSAECYDFMKVIVKRRNHVADKELFESIRTLMQNSILTTECRQPERRLEISGAVAAVLIKLEGNNIREVKSISEDNRKNYDTARKIADYIELHYAEPISGENIEREFYLTFDYANRIFHKIMGCTIIKYRNIVRIQHAKARMRATNMSFKEIALEAGIENTHYFSRIFKKIEGLSPSEYKKKFLKPYDREEEKDEFVQI